jgi:hypothetical protein
LVLTSPLDDGWLPIDPQPQLMAVYTIPIIDWLAGKLLLGLASTVIIGSESHGAHDHILQANESGNLQNCSGYKCSSVFCCWSSPAQSILVPRHVGNDNLIYVSSKTVYMFGNGVSSSTRGRVCLSVIVLYRGLNPQDTHEMATFYS